MIEKFCKKYNLYYGVTDYYQKSEYEHYYIHVPNGFEEENIFDGRELGTIISQFEKVEFGYDVDKDEVILDLANEK